MIIDKSEPMLKKIDWNARCAVCHCVVHARHPEKVVVCRSHACLDYLRRKKPLALATVQLADKATSDFKYTGNDILLIEKIFEEKKGVKQE